MKILEPVKNAEKYKKFANKKNTTPKMNQTIYARKK